MIHQDIDRFITSMQEVLSDELIEFIIRKYIFLPENKMIIRKQKKLKNVMHLQLLFVSSLVYIDDNYYVYLQNNKIIIHNHGNQSYDISLYNYNGMDTVNNNSFLLTSSNMIVNGSEFSNIGHTYSSNLVVDVNENSSNLVMYIMYI